MSTTCPQLGANFALHRSSRRRLAVLLLGLATGALGELDPTCRAQADAPTLMRWHYGDGGDGGPNLNEPIVTDRPDFTEASSTVGRGVFQIESGYTYAFDDDGTESTIANSFPEMLIRVGVLADWLELRLAWDYLVEDVGDQRLSGAEDMYLGAKIGLTGQAGLLPEMAIMPQMTVPTGAGVFSAHEVQPGLNWLYGWDVTDTISTGGSTQYNRGSDEDTFNAFTAWSQSWTINYSLADNLGAYTEWFGIFPHSSDTERAQNYFDGGFTVLITDDVQWDIRAGVGLNDAADDYFVGSGLSMRFQ